MTEPLLDVEDLHVAYGPVRALRGCSLQVLAGETVVVVGANGAGKSTLLRALSGLLPPASGRIHFSGQLLGRLTADRLVRLGMTHVPEGRGVIGRLTVAENLRLAYEMRPSTEPYAQALQRVFERFARLQERIGQRAGNLSGGEQQMLALARAVINPPRLLLVDEPSLGLSPAMVKEAFAALQCFRESGVTLLLVEQNVRQALALADRAYVLRQGQIVHQGAGPQLLADRDMLRYYLGSH